MGAVDEFVQRQSRAAGVPGVAYAVVGGGAEHQGAFGVDGDGRAVDPRTPFLWGSVSKPVTATLVVLLARDGLLRLDDPVGRLVPSFATTNRITVRQLLEHTSGLPEGLTLTDRYDAGRSIASLLPQIAGLEPVAEPGSKHNYSSLNYIVLGAVVESVTGKPFAQVLSERLLTPAGITGPLADASKTGQVLPAGHRFVFGGTRAFESHVDPATVPAGYLVGSVEDLAAYARTQLTGGRVLDAKDRGLLHTSKVSVGYDNGYALGWRTSKVPGTDEPMVWHGGAAPGYQAAIVLLPKRNQAVVVLQNAYSPFHDAALMDTAMGTAALLIAAESERNSTDPIYPALLAALSALAVTLLALVVATTLRLRRQPKPRSPGRRWAGLALTLLTLGALSYALAGVLPGLAGVTLTQLSLWAPDLSALVYLAVLLCAALAAIRLLTTVLHSRRHAPPST
ncbi:hypothetical protein GCM10009534_17880 [Kribbella sandramycini]